MIVEKILYAIKCDVCNQKADDWCYDIDVWLEKEAIDRAYLRNWLIYNDKHYCTDCHSFDNEGNLIIKTKT